MWRTTHLVAASLVTAGCSLIVPGPDDFTYDGVDGGMDAGPSDAGADAGAPDAGPDSGSRDAGATDAGTTDAGPGGCARDEDCTGDPAGDYCDEPSRTCVACTVDREEDACGSSATCDPVAFTCTGGPRYFTEICEECVASSQCALLLGDFPAPDNPQGRCVETFFGATSIGFHCVASLSDLRTATGDPLYGCPSGLSQTSVTDDREGRRDTYCVPSALTTCPGLIFGDRRRTCPRGTDAECGVPGLDDARCVSNICQSRCDFGRDCFSNICSLGLCASGS